MKRRVVFNEFNIPTNNSIYFPYVSGLLRAYTEQFDFVKQNYDFGPFNFLRESIDEIVEKHENVDVACFSSSMWNHQLSLKVAKKVKEKYPNCLITFGGPQVTLGEKLYKENPFIDVGVFGEGERFFKWLLNARLTGEKIEQKTYRTETTIDNLDDCLSPYSLGLFNDILDKHKDIEFKAIMETNRSCVFSCDFCYFGQSDFNKKIKHHSLEYLQKEVEWLAKNKVKYIFCADANFGMFKRDIDIAKLYGKIKKKYNYPEKFRVCYGKNATDTIYQTAKILSEADLAKTVTLALQSVSQSVLKNIHRSNIKSSVFVELQKKYTAAGIPTYTEIILGLPGETIESFLDGIEFVLESSNDNQVFIYHCQILNNTPMAEPSYLEKYKIQTVKAPLAEVHGSIRDNHIEREFEYVVVANESMPTEDWKYCAVLAWLIQLFYSLKVGHKVVKYLFQKFNIKYTEYFKYLYNLDIPEIQYFKQRAIDITNGQSRCQYDLRFGQIYWEPEELVYLLMSLNKEDFYKKIFNATINFLNEKKVDFNLKELTDIFAEQSKEIPDHENYASTEEYATKVILHGRKSNLNKPIGFQLLDNE